jgi:hypothetical protein
MLNENLIRQLAKRGEEIFVRPSSTFSWNEIVFLGCPIPGSRKQGRAVSPNTWRAHKMREDVPNVKGSSGIYYAYFFSRQNQLLEQCVGIKSWSDWHKLLNQIHEELLPELQKNIVPKITSSYNAIHKPLDLFFEHLVAMATELEGHRDKLVPLLALPLDKVILTETKCFKQEELDGIRYKRGCGYTTIRTERAYLLLQNALRKRCRDYTKRLGVEFHPIYFDLLWNKRYTKPGRNLFETNP